MGGLPYGLVLVVAAGVLVARHARSDHASTRSKRAVGVAAVASALALPVWPLIAAVVQLGVCVYVIFHRIVTDALTAPEGDEAGVSRPAEPGPSAAPTAGPPARPGR